jgi:TFIIH basal transcription factor complex TTD-A subunit
MARAIKGMLIKCDPSIKSLVVKIDQDYRDIVIEELDDTHLLIDPSKLTFIKKELNRILADNAYNVFDDEEAITRL